MTDTRTSRTSRTVRTLTTGAVLAGALAAGVATTAAPASAATTVTFCFTWSQTGAAYANWGADLWQVDSSGNWIAKIRPGKTNANGCGTFTATPSNMYLRVYAHVEAGGHAWGGASSYWANPGVGVASVRNSYVYPIY